jgi:hypothetical protein
MENQNPPRDSDPSDMTDFEKNATSEVLKSAIAQPDSINRQERARATKTKRDERRSNNAAEPGGSRVRSDP